MVKKTTLRTVTFTLHDESTVVATDTATANIGSAALEAFKAKQIVVVEGETKTYIPFHAIVKVVVAEESTTQTVTDAACN